MNKEKILKLTLEYNSLLNDIFSRKCLSLEEEKILVRVSEFLESETY